jgi:ferredoxin
MDRSHRITFLLPDGSRPVVEVSPRQHILDAAFGAGIELPSMCLQGWCLTCAAHVENRGDWDNRDALRYFEEDREAGFILLCTARAKSDLVVRTHRREAMRDARRKIGLPAPIG